MLTLYNYLESLIEEHNGRQWYFEARLDHFANDVFDTLNVNDIQERIQAIDRAMNACRSLGIPSPAHFRRAYRFDGEWLLTDWKISALACYLITINCDPTNTNVAKAQLFFAMNQIRQNTEH